MNKIVYLHELDSVKKFENKTKEGVLITPGVNALFNEIIKQGNVVAITLNQLTDSQFISEIIEDDVAYEAVLKLFELGAIRVSMYNYDGVDMRTASQYLQRAINKCMVKVNNDTEESTFIFSNFPVDSKDIRMLLTVQNALMHSDLSELKNLEESKINITEKENIRKIYRFVKMVLHISVCETSNIPVNRENQKKLFDFINSIKSILIENKIIINNESINEKVLQLLKKASTEISSGREYRSAWIKYIEKTDGENSVKEMAKEIIHLSYNYKLEDSISGGSKHYCDEVTFKEDVLCRIKLLCNEINGDSEYNEKLKKRQWKQLIRFAEYRDNKDIESRRYEDNYYIERTTWICRIFVKTVKTIMMAFVYGIVFVAAELIITFIETGLHFPIEIMMLLALMKILIMGIIGAVLNKGLKQLNKKEDIPDILQDIINIFTTLFDFACVIGGKYDSYRLP